MTLKVTILPRAEQDAQAIFDWISKRSPQGAAAWWSAFEAAATQVLDEAAQFGLAPENILVPY